MSSLPDVLSLVTIRSKALLRAVASAARLSGTLSTAQEPGSRTRHRRVWIWGSASTTSAFLTAERQLSMLGAELIFTALPGSIRFAVAHTSGYGCTVFA